MNGGPLDWPKHTYRGAIVRRQLLESVGCQLPLDLAEGNSAPTDDVLDAAAAAWSAARIAAKHHVSLPDPPERFRTGYARPSTSRSTGPRARIRCPHSVVEVP